MKLLNVTDIDGLFHVINQCTGKVELVGEDIRLNLKSKLAQYFSLAKVFSAGNEIEKLELHCENWEDNERLINFLIRGTTL